MIGVLGVIVMLLAVGLLFLAIACGMSLLISIREEVSKLGNRVDEIVASFAEAVLSAQEAQANAEEARSKAEAALEELRKESQLSPETLELVGRVLGNAVATEPIEGEPVGEEN